MATRNGESDTQRSVTSTPVQYALRYARLGWPVFPCVEGGKRPASEHGFKDATLDESAISSMWRDNPRANIGVPSGAQFWVLDVDAKSGGLESLRDLENQYGELPATLYAKTPSGGMHFFFAPRPDIANTASKIAPGIDTRGHGGYVCVEGSLVEGNPYSFTDFDPLFDELPELATAPVWLLNKVIAERPQLAAQAVDTGETVPSGGRNDFLTRQAGRLRKAGYSIEVMDAALQVLNNSKCNPPLPASEVSAIANSIGRYEAGNLIITPDVPRQRIMDFGVIGRAAPPPRQWLLPHWLSNSPTLVAGKGGVGKSLLSLQVAYGLASQTPVFGHTCTREEPLRVLYWACEDDYDELWRRLTGISIAAKVPLADVKTMVVDARAGLENELYTLSYGAGVWTPQKEILYQQVNDYKADILILDNVAHLYSAGENNRPAVTAFINGIIGLCMDRPFCPIMLAHPAKADGSEYSGSTAWENAVRMRWFLSDKLPDQKSDDDEQPSDSMRFLSKRKTNYTTLDYMQLNIEHGAFHNVSGEISDGGNMMASLRILRCKSIVLASIPRIADSGRISSDVFGSNYLPKQIIAQGWHEGHSKAELHKAMMELFGEGRLLKAEVGKDSARRPRIGLVVVQP